MSFSQNILILDIKMNSRLVHENGTFIFHVALKEAVVDSAAATKQ